MFYKEGAFIIAFTAICGCRHLRSHGHLNLRASLDMGGTRSHDRKQAKNDDDERRKA